MWLCTNSFTLLFFVGLSILLSTTECQAQNNEDARFIRYTTADGLSNPWISDIHQSKDGFIWIATQYGINRFDGLAFESHVYNPNDLQSLNNNWVMSIAESPDSHIWLGTYGKSLHEYDPVKESFQRHHGSPDDICYLEWIDKITIDGNDGIWIATRRGELIEYSISDKKNCVWRSSLGYTINDLLCTDRLVLCGTANGLYIIDKSDKEILTVLSQGEEVQTVTRRGNEVFYSIRDKVHRIVISENGSFSKSDVLVELSSEVEALDVAESQLFVGGAFGLIKYDLHNGERQEFHHDLSNPHSLIDGSIKSVMIDKDENVWVGSTEGLCMLPAHQKQYTSELVHPSIARHERAYTFGFSGGDVYVGNNFGLTKYPSDHLQSPTQLLSGRRIRSLINEPYGNLIFGSDLPPMSGTKIGVYKLDPSTDNISQYHRKGDGNLSTDGPIHHLIIDDYGGVLAAGTGRLYYLFHGTNRFTDISDLFAVDWKESGILLNMIIDQEGFLWIGTTQDGLYKIKWKKPDGPFDHKDIKKYTYDPNDNYSISSDLIMYLHETKEGKIWIATDGGLNEYDSENDHFTRYTRENGLSGDKILGIEEDSTGQLWMSTISHGLLSFDPDRLNFVHYRQKDGIYHDAFLLQSVSKRSDGLLFWGNEGGVQVFNPYEFDQYKADAGKIILTDIYVNNEKLRPGTSHVIESAPEYLSRLDLAHDQNDLTLSFGLPDYQHSNQYRFKYQLQGASDGWVHLDQIQRISFAHLAPGTYKLTIEGCLFSDCIRSNSLEIKIARPWWLSGWAIVVYLLAILSFAVAAVKLISLRQKEKLELLKQEEIARTQAQFFTNMAHEIRTPLTLIIGPAKRLLSKQLNPSLESSSIIDNISKQADHILSLVNNLLDLSKIDAGLAPLQLKETEISQFLVSIVDSFRFEFVQNKIELNLTDETRGYTAKVDREKVRIIVSNILSNAAKYSSEGDQISAHFACMNEMLHMVIKDTGIGMSADELDQLFQRFYRANSSENMGSGIGMALVKEVIDLLSGTITVDSQINEGTSVSISIPLKEMYVELIEEEDEEDDTDLFQILLVEDNPEIARFVKGGLVEKYNVAVVENGKDGFQEAIKRIPNLIISDIMMPKQDGFELCQQLKSHPLTDHIPVIMLSARSDEQSRIKAMQSGADGYLTKPYNDDELLLQIENILTTRSNLLKKRHISSAEVSHESSPFMKDLRLKAEQLLDKSDLSIKTLCETLFISRSQLHRKIKNVTGQSTTELLNEIKLSRALQLLSYKDLTIAEICYESGFTAPSYFSQIFQRSIIVRLVSIGVMSGKGM